MPKQAHTKQKKYIFLNASRFHTSKRRCNQSSVITSRINKKI
uniref:Uncharacterized protein n=1 Tax=Ciona intestinalis TaxID=7719 RepID=H2XXV5_CIOIN